MKNIFKRKKKEINISKCEKCDGSLELTEVTEKNIDYILENIDLSNFPKFIQKMDKIKRDKLLIVFINRSYTLYMCNKCNFFKLVR